MATDGWLFYWILLVRHPEMRTFLVQYVRVYMFMYVYLFMAGRQNKDKINAYRFQPFHHFTPVYSDNLIQMFPFYIFLALHLIAR